MSMPVCVRSFYTQQLIVVKYRSTTDGTNNKRGLVSSILSRLLQSSTATHETARRPKRRFSSQPILPVRPARHHCWKPSQLLLGDFPPRTWRLSRLFVATRSSSSCRLSIVELFLFAITRSRTSLRPGSPTVRRRRCGAK